MRIQQALGLPATTTSTNGLTLFWVPIANLARPAYSADVSAQLPDPLQDGSDPSLGFDPFRASSFFGVSEFIVSAGSKIVHERFIPNAELGIWVVPEPSAGLIVIAGFSGLGWVVRRRVLPCVHARPTDPQRQEI